MVFNIYHVLEQITRDLKEIEENGTHYVIYFGFELFEISIFAYSKITEDLLLQLNRDRTILQISIFQQEYLKEIDPSLHSKISVSGDNKYLKDQIEEIREEQEQRRSNEAIMTLRYMTKSA